MKSFSRAENKIIKSLEKKENNKIIKNMLSKTYKIIKVDEAFMKKKLSLSNNKKLIKTFEKFHKKIALEHAHTNTLIDAIDGKPSEVLKEKINNAIPKNISSKEKLKIIFNLINPLHTSFTKQEELAILKVVIDISKKNKSINNIDKELKQLTKKYWWTDIGWENIKLKDEKYFKKEIAKLQKKLNNPEKKQKEIILELKQKVDTRNKTIKEYKINKKTIYWISMFDKFTELHDLRKEAQMKTLYNLYRFIKEVAQRTNHKVDDLEWFLFDELCEILNGKKLDKETLTKRKKSVSYATINYKTTIYIGEESEKFRAKELNEEFQPSKEVRGTPASPGVVQGRAKICHGLKDAAKKMKKGDILITNMTLPNYLSYMKKAGAIVTDEGGITSHAAIVSRELGKPCVIGTKIATKIFKDGDLVEVDANKGIVRKLE
ncbi:MAG: hypothetical protein KKF89_05850 [Nanoarchaeota archaeon]|nr:hypothetical protein [Nanoarchaeota archaeon]MBU1855221.1 hypothetical protein [Nanoarchaeota archaeon]